MAVFSQTFLQADIPFNLGNGQFRTFSKDELREFVDNSRRMMFDGNLGIHVKSEHPPPGSDEGAPTPFEELSAQFDPSSEQFADAIKTAGWVKDLHFDDATGTAKVLFEVKSKPYIQAIREDRIRFSSPEFRTQYQDGLGREWGPTIAHFALTPKPRNPLQTVIKETSSGQQQFAMQFSMADAVGIEPKDLPTIQFYAPTGGGGGMGKGMSPSGAGRVRQAGARKLKPPTNPENTNAADAEGKPPENDMGPAGAIDPASQQPGMPRMKRPQGMAPGSKLYRQKYQTFGRKNAMPGPGYGRQPAALSEQFDTNMMDQAPGYPGAIPPIPTGPQSFDPSGLGGQTDMLGGLPVENPDVIQAPDDQKRQKSEAAVQLLDQIGISLAVGTDLTKLDDSALDSLLAALKTKIKANQEAEEAEMASMQDQQLKEQVPMIGQMSEQEADAIIGHTLVEIAQFDNEKSRLETTASAREGSLTKKTRRKYRKTELDKYEDSQGRSRPDPDDTYSKKTRVRPGVHVQDYSRLKGKKKAKQLSEGTQQMSESALHQRLANFKQRHDKQARQGLRKLIATSKLPPGMKAKLAGDISSVQFAESGPEVPAYTIQDVIDLFNGSCPDGMQFGDKTLVDAMDEPGHPKGDRWGKRGSEQINAADAAQFAQDGVTMSEADLRAYYDQKAKQPDWASRLMPVANGNGRTH